MKKFIIFITSVFPCAVQYNISILVFRIVISIELMVVHGLNKAGIGAGNAEQVPDPFHLPHLFNQGFAISANLFFPLFVIFGFLTRLAVMPILVVTITGYFIVHWNDSLLVKDTAFMYSVVYLLILILGPGKYSIDYLINKNIRQ